MALVESKPPKLDALARTALDAYELADIRLRLLEQKKNATFRVDAREPGNGMEAGRFVLRVCEEGEDAYDEAELSSELVFLRALRKATGLVVPDPLPTRGGEWVVRRSLPGSSGSRLCVLFRWVPGQMVEDAPTPERLEKVGALLARIHLFSQDFEPPEGFVRPRWDARGLFGDGPVLKPGQGDGLVSDRGRDLLDEAARRIRDEMAQLGEGPEVFGIVHKDLEPDNTLTDGDEVHAIDFADCGWGYYLYDIAAALLPLKEKPGFEAKREALLRGYRSVRPLAAEHVAKLETFLVARGIFASRLMLGKLWDLPQIRSYAESAVPQILGGVRRFLEQAGSVDGSERTRTTIRFLSHVRSLGIKLWNEGDRLRFEAPKGTMTPELLGELKERKSEILGFLRQGATAAPPLEPVPEAERHPIPLSFAQQRLWFIDRLVPESPAYNIARALRLTGRVRVRVVAESLREITRRHESLRTKFTERGGEPIQVVAERLDLHVPLVDLSGLPEDRREDAAHGLSLKEARRPFDLERGPLLRVFLTRLSLSDHIGPSSMHHIVGDGWSSGILFQELGQIYGAFAEGKPTPFPELPIQYPDFAIWQRKWLQGEVLEDQLAYWRDHLGGAPQLLELPTDRPRSASTSQRSTRERCLLPATLVDRLKSFAQARGATLFMILLAAFKVLLYRHAGQRDLLVGSPIANRNRAEVERLIGFFANTLVLRTRLDGETRFRDLLEQVRQTTLGAYAHQDLPFEKIVEELRPNRTVSDTPLFQVAFTLQNVPSPDMRVADFRMSLMPPTSRSTPFDLNLNMKEMPEGVRTSWNYKRDLFDATTIRRLVRHYAALLEAVVETPDLGAGELRMLSCGERHQLLHELNDTGAVLPAGSLAEMFDAWVRRAPGAPAVLTDDDVWSYRRLDDHARGLARALRSRGVKDGDLVGVSSRRSPELVAGLLAVVRLGAAYVPLDPEYPEDRLRFMLEETALRAVLVDGEMETRLAFLEDRRLPLAGPGWEPDDAQPAGSLDHVVYVIYTSGSTGRPKGTAVSQRAVVRLVRNTDYVHLGPDDRTAHMSNTSFDAATFEIWGALLNGGAVVVLDRETVLSPPDFVERLRRHRVSAMFVTVSLFNQVVREIPDAFRTVGCVLFGGEAADPASVRRCLEAGPPERLLNGYGPTETTTFACTHVTGHVAPDARTVPIGRPIANTSVHVLDRSGRPTALGVSGELYIGGPGLGLGYLRRPGRTAQRFVPHPFAEAREGGERLYRTGDRVRRRPADGAVEFLGRFDDQVKIRGFRIEPGEIAVALETHPAVAEAAVKVWEVGTAERRLAAYVVTSGSEADGGELRGFLRDRLPDFMVPKSVVFLEAMPLTANGKLDRAALPEPVWGSSEGDALRLPETPTEKLVAGIWQEVLDVERPGVDRDFFELGGHSLLATRVLSRVREIFEVELPLQTLFDATTVEALARTVDEALRREHGLDDVPLEPVDRSGEIPLSFAQRRLWFLDQLEPGGSVYNVPAVLDLQGSLQGGRLAQVFTEVSRRQGSLRTTFPDVESRPRQEVGDPLPVILRRVDLTGLAPKRRQAEARRLARRETGRPFELTAGPLVRFFLIRTEAQRHVLGITMHHIVSDGWSLGVLLREVAALDPAFRQGRPSPLEELSIQYVDFAAWQRRWLAQHVLDHELAYWTRRLAGAPAVLELPTDRPRPATETFRGRARSVVLAPETAQAAGELARREGVTLYMVLLAVFQALLARWTGQEDVVVGSPIAGRPRRELEDLVGFFVNTLVLRTDLEGAPSFRVLLSRVRETALGAYAHQNLPFERLVEELAPRRDLAHSPLFQVMFVLQNAPLGSVDLQDLRFSRFAVAGDTSMFDLTLALSEDDAAGLGGTLTYNRDLFDATTMERFVRGFGSLLASAVADPDRSPAELPWGSEAERHQLLREHNDAPAPRRTVPSTTLHGGFEAQVRRAPDAPAVVHGEDCWSYDELNRRADSVARGLIELGVRPEDRVGICLRRSPWMVAALLGAWKAGAAYVPLDPGYPRERLAFMLEDAGIEVLVAQEETRSVLPETGVRVLVPADLQDVEDVPSPAFSSGPDGLAYVIYTSGSTGRPKGVAIGHRSASARMAWAHDTFTPEEMAGVLASTSINFDLSVFELFAPLTCGGRVILVADALELAHQPAASEVRLVNTVPSAMVELLRLGDVPSSVETVNLAGEPLRRSLVEQIYATGHVRSVRNLYGPSEDTTYSTGARIEPGTGEPTIGRPLPGTRGHVLDGRMRRTPLGVPGELYLEGEGLARGYLGRPCRTARAWVPNPYGGEGSRLYRTGDRVRRQADGTLEFLGRFDHQVKLRGYRIELGEIEAALLTRPEVRETVVTVTGHGEASGSRLAAYVEVDGEGEATPERLRRDLARTLPEYMLPSVFVLLPELPRTPNGKIDRKALPEPGGPEPSAAPSAAPRNLEEEIVADVWAEVLGLERVGVHDDFFALGGHSLLATRVISRVRRAFDLELPLTRLFEAPTVAGLARAVDAARRGGRGSMTPPLRRREPERTDPLPLSFAQERLWFFESLEPQRPAYNLPAAIRVRGELRPELVWQTFRDVVRRHEALRTRFPAPEGEPHQEIVDAPRVALPRVDLSGLEARDRQPQGRRLAGAEGARPFDLTSQVPFRLTLVGLDGEEHLLLSTFHHIASDAWSTTRLLEEVSVLQEQFGSGRPSHLAELPIQYGDFAVWQRDWLCGDVLEHKTSGARERLDGAPEMLELATDRPRRAVPSYRVGTRHRRIAPDVVEALGKLSRRAGATLFMTALGAFEILLGRWAGQRDLLVGSPVAGRPPEAEDLIGFFVNTLVLRGRWHGDQSFVDFLGTVRRDALAAFDHQDLPFERLVEELTPRRDLSRPPLVQALLVFQNVPRRALDSGDLRWEPMGRTTPEGAVYDLTLVLEEAPDGSVSAALHFARDLFDPTTAERFLRHYETLLGGIGADPERILEQHETWSPEERHQVLAEWNDTGRSSPEASTVVDLLDLHVAQRPDAVAVVGEREHLSYRELDVRSRRLARALSLRGVEPEEPVGLAVGRSPERVVGLVGILRSGAAFLPLDPSYPSKRLVDMARDAGLRCLVADAEGTSALQEADLSILPPSPSPASPPDGSDDTGVPVPEPDRLAYLIYTSGSTGRPKGVAVPHRGLPHVVAAQRQALGVDPASRVLQFSSPGFDASVFETVMALGSGATLCLGEVDTTVPGEPLAAMLRRQQVTLCTLTPSTLSVLPGAATLPALETVTVAGEACPRRLVERWAPGRRFFNLYGPTEATIWATAAPCPVGETGAPSIGRPVPHGAVVILDRAGRPVPLGVRGELALTGVGLARGYLGRPARTARSFVPDAVTDRSGERLYCTGDVARWLPDGRLDFLGRLDQQVQVRGVRVELGEVEAALTALPEVKEAVAALHEGDTEVPRLVAYLVFENGREVDPERVRQALRTRLPEVMVPSLFVSMEALPATLSGKVDRKALPAPELRRGDAEPIEPRTPLEEELTEIWRDVLGTRAVGVRDDFFEAGGHSLSAVRLAAAVRRRLDRELPLSVLFRGATVERVARWLDGADGAPMEPRVLWIGSGHRAPWVLIHPLGGHLLPYRSLVDELARLDPDRSIYGLELPPGFRPTSVDALAERHLETLDGWEAFEPGEPRVLTGWSTGGVLAYAMACRLEALGRPVPRVVLLDAVLEGGASQRVLTEKETRHLFDREVAALRKAEIDQGWLDRTYETVSAELEAFAAYEPGRFGGGVTLVRAADAPHAATIADPWRRLVSGDLEVLDTPGDHHSMLIGAGAGELAKCLTSPSTKRRGVAR